MKRVTTLLPAAIALIVFGGCVIVSEKKPADSAPPPPPPATAPAPTATVTDTGSVTDAAPAATATATAAPGPALKQAPSRDAGN